MSISTVNKTTVLITGGNRGMTLTNSFTMRISPGRPESTLSLGSVVFRTTRAPAPPTMSVFLE